MRKLRPEPLQYGHMPPPARWRVMPLMIASGVYGACITLLAFVVDTRFRNIFVKFKIALPTGTDIMLRIARLIWGDHLWLAILPAAFLWPLILVPYVPAPIQPESRQAIIRTVRYLFLLIYIGVAITVAALLMTPMMRVFGTVSGPP